MFWKNTAWSWDDAQGNDDDDDGGGYLLAVDLRRTPDFAPDTELHHSTTTTTTTVIATNQSKNSSNTTTRLKDKTNDSLTLMFMPNLDPTNTNYSSVPANTTNSSYVSTLDASANHHQATRIRSSPQQLRVSPMSQTFTVTTQASSIR